MKLCFLVFVFCASKHIKRKQVESMEDRAWKALRKVKERAVATGVCQCDGELHLESEGNWCWLNRAAGTTCKALDDTTVTTSWMRCEKDGVRMVICPTPELVTNELTSSLIDLRGKLVERRLLPAIVYASKTEDDSLKTEVKNLENRIKTLEQKEEERNCASIGISSKCTNICEWTTTYWGGKCRRRSTNCCFLYTAIDGIDKPCSSCSSGHEMSNGKCIGTSRQCKSDPRKEEGPSQSKLAHSLKRAEKRIAHLSQLHQLKRGSKFEHRLAHLHRFMNSHQEDVVGKKHGPHQKF